MEQIISQLVEYAVRKEWIKSEDRTWAANQILAALHMDGFEGLVSVDELPPIQTILDQLCNYAYEHGIIDGNSTAWFDLLDTKLIGLLIPRPAEISARFKKLYEHNGAKAATDWYYDFSRDANYIRRDRI